MASVAVELDNGDRLTSVCTADSIDEAGIARGRARAGRDQGSVSDSCREEVGIFPTVSRAPFM